MNNYTTYIIMDVITNPFAQSQLNHVSNKGDVKRRNTFSCLDHRRAAGWDCDIVGTMKRS